MRSFYLPLKARHFHTEKLLGLALQGFPQKGLTDIGTEARLAENES